MTILSTLNSINNKLDAIVKALKAKNCGDCGGFELEPPPADTPGDPEIDPNPSDPNFPTWQAFDDYKCKTANALVDYWTRFLFDAANRDWDSLATGGLAIVVDAVGILLLEAGLAAVGITIASGPVVIAGLLIAVAVFVITNATLDFADMAQTLEVNRDDLICVLYKAASADQARTDFEAELTSLGYTSVESGLFSLLANLHDYNKLFELDEEINSSDYNPTLDCSACNEGGSVIVPMLVNSCVMDESMAWRHGNTAELLTGIMPSSRLFDEGIRCFGNTYGSDLPVAVDGIWLPGSSGADNYIGFVWTPPSNGRVTILHYRSSSSASVLFEVREGYMGTVIHSQSVTGGTITGGTNYQWQFDFVAGTEYHVTWKSPGSHSWVFAGGSFG